MEELFGGVAGGEVRFLVVGFSFGDKCDNEAREINGCLPILGVYDGFGITRDCGGLS